MSAWEAMPLLDLAIKEVLRLTLSGTSLRRVLKPGVVIDGYEIPVGSFLCYPIGTLIALLAHAIHTPHVTLPGELTPAGARPHPPGREDLQGAPQVRSRPLPPAAIGGGLGGLLLPRLGRRCVNCPPSVAPPHTHGV